MPNRGQASSNDRPVIEGAGGSNLRGVTDDTGGGKMVTREKEKEREGVMRVTSKHSSSRRGFFLVSLLVRLVGKPVERVEPHDLWIRTALHRSTYRHHHHRPRASTISHCYQTQATPNYFHSLTTLPAMLPGVPCKHVV